MRKEISLYHAPRQRILIVKMKYSNELEYTDVTHFLI